MWSFVQLSDPQLGGQTDTQEHNRVIRTLMPDIIACLRQDLAEVNPDFILATGDISGEQSRDSVFAARDLLDSLGFQYYPMGGNRDFAREESRVWFLDAFSAHLPIQDTVYSFTHRGLHVCILDPWWRWPDGTLSPHAADDLPVREWAIPPHQLEWLDRDLSAHASEPTIVGLHSPAADVPTRLRRPGMADHGRIVNADMLGEFLGRHSCVRAVFSGHRHMHYVAPAYGLVHIVTASLPTYPNEYRVVHVYQDRLEVETRGLSDASFAQCSLVSGNEWTAGEEEDRSLTISL